MAQSAALHVLVFTEDGTKHTWRQAYETIRDLLKKLFRHLDASTQTQRITFEHIGDEELRELLAANNFKDPPEALCFGKAHNLDLVAGYPTAEVVAAEKSLHAAVETLRGCEALIDALRRTHETGFPAAEST